MQYSKLVLVTGATGYIGDRLVPHLLQAGYRVRCLVRDSNRLQGRPRTDQEAWLQFEAQPLPEGRTRLVQTILMAPKGLLGFLYGYGLYPFHGLIFRNLNETIARHAEALSSSQAAQHATR